MNRWVATALVVAGPFAFVGAAIVFTQLPRWVRRSLVVVAVGLVALAIVGAWLYIDHDGEFVFHDGRSRQERVEQSLEAEVQGSNPDSPTARCREERPDYWSCSVRDPERRLRCRGPVRSYDMVNGRVADGINCSSS